VPVRYSRDEYELTPSCQPYRAAIRLQPDYAAAYLNLGLALRYRREPEGAITAFPKARDLASPGSNLARLIEQALVGLEENKVGNFFVLDFILFLEHIESTFYAVNVPLFADTPM
jgi:tetratricopeptide (TPR) repeat protein